jgi:hypothetical protein
VQLQGVSSRRAHHLKKNYSIWKEEEVLGHKAYWVFIVGPRAPFLAYCGRGFSVFVLFGAWHELERRRAHYRKRIHPLEGSDLLQSA